MLIFKPFISISLNLLISDILSFKALFSFLNCSNYSSKLSFNYPFYYNKLSISLPFKFKRPNNFAFSPFKTSISFSCYFLEFSRLLLNLFSSFIYRFSIAYLCSNSRFVISFSNNSLTF